MTGINDLPALPGGYQAGDVVPVGRSNTAFGFPLSSLLLPLEVSSIALLRANTAPVGLVYVAGYRTPRDGGEGQFLWEPNDTTSADDGGTIIVDQAGHRFYRAGARNGFLHVAWFGAAGDGVTDDTATMNGCLAVASALGACRVILDHRQFLINTADFVIPPGASVIGPWAGVRGENAVTFDYTAIPGSIIMNPAFTVRVMHSAALEGVCVRPSTLLPGTTVANLVANQLGKVGTGVTIGTGVNTGTGVGTGDDARVERNLIIGFNRAIDCNGSSRSTIDNNEFDCTNGIRIANCYDWSAVRNNEGWDFLTGHNPLFNAQCVINITSSSIVGSYRRFVTAAPHGLSTGWPVCITTSHVGAGVAPCIGVSPVTVIDAVTFDLRTDEGLTTAVLNTPTGPGTGTGTGGQCFIALPINFGVAYECDTVMDWGKWSDNDSWGWAVGSQVNGCANVTYNHCGHDNFFEAGFWYQVGFQATGSAGAVTWLACQVAAHETGWSLATLSGVEGNSNLLVGCSSWGMNGAFVDLEAGSAKIIGGKFEDTLDSGSNIYLGANGGLLEVIGVEGAPPIVNETGNPMAVRITGGDYSFDTQTMSIVAAAGTTQGTATPITTQIASVTTTTNGLGVILPVVVPGTAVTVINTTLMSLNVYPDAGSQLGGATENEAFPQTNGTVTYIRASATDWQLSGLSYPYNTDTISTLAAAGTNQGTATPIATQVALVDAVTAGQGVILPLVGPGTSIKVINTTSTAVDVYPDTGAQIGGQSLNASVAQGNGAVTYTRTSASVWTVG